MNEQLHKQTAGIHALTIHHSPPHFGSPASFKQRDRSESGPPALSLTHPAWASQPAALSYRPTVLLSYITLLFARDKLPLFAYIGHMSLRIYTPMSTTI